MKAKRGAASQKRAAKSKRPSGSGFASNPPRGSEKEGGRPKDAAKATVVESASGATGDASPHRALVDGPASATMEDPAKVDPLDGPDKALVPIPSLTKDDIASLRFDRKLSLDEMIERFEDARRGDNFAATVIANRHFVSEKLLYRFTSAILQVESRTDRAETKEEEAANMRQFRQDLIAHCWSNDYPLKVELQRAEGRLLRVLQGDSIKNDVRRNCGTTTLQVDAFWIVVFAAIAAWEERGKENPELVNVDMQKALTTCAQACRTLDEVNKRLSPSLAAVQKILESADPNVQQEVVAELDDDDVADMSSFAEQVRLFPSGAYGALVVRMSSILDYIMADKYGIAAVGLQPFRFEVPTKEIESKLVTFAKNSQKIRRAR